MHSFVLVAVDQDQEFGQGEKVSIPQRQLFELPLNDTFKGTKYPYRVPIEGVVWAVMFSECNRFCYHWRMGIAPLGWIVWGVWFDGISFILDIESEYEWGSGSNGRRL